MKTEKRLPWPKHSNAEDEKADLLGRVRSVAAELERTGHPRMEKNISSTWKATKDAASVLHTDKVARADTDLREANRPERFV